MAGRIRTIKPELLEDERTAGLSNHGFRLFVGMLLLADDYGNLRAHPGQLHGSVFWAIGATSSETAAALAELHTKELVELYTQRGQTYGHIAGWDKHQRVDKPGKPRCPKPSDDGVVREIRETLARLPHLTSDLRPPNPTSDPDPEGDPDTSQASACSGTGPAAERTARKAEPPPEAIELAEYLELAIRSHAPDYQAGETTAKRTARISGWAKHMDLAIRQDKRTPEQLRSVIDFAHRGAGVFWRANLLSGRKVREHYERLRMQSRQQGLMGGALPGYKPRGLTGDDLRAAAAAMRAEEARLEHGEE